MIDFKFITQNSDAIQKNCDRRGVKADIAKLIEIHHLKNQLLQKVESNRCRQNEIAQSIPKEKDPQTKLKLIEEGKELKGLTVNLEKQLQEVTLQLNALSMAVPNMTHPDSPIGGEEDYTVIRHVGVPPTFSFAPKNHLEIAQHLQLIDFEAGAEVAGQKFYFLKNQAVFLELALIRYALDIAVKHGFTPTTTPDLAKTEILEGIGFTPRGEETQIYSIANHDLCLIGTAEITIGGMLKNRIIPSENLPIKMAGISHCFRTEAGAAGRESKGLYRVHQFSKVELFVFSHPEHSETFHQELLTIEEEIFKGLELPYRVIDIASGDLGAPAYRKFDIEAWMPGRGDHGGYGEVTSTSNCTDFQARRLGIRTRDALGKTLYLHTLNGTAVAVPRVIIALLENGQQADGSVMIPKALVPYTGFDRICI